MSAHGDFISNGFGDSFFNIQISAVVAFLNLRTITGRQKPIAMSIRQS